MQATVDVKLLEMQEESKELAKYYYKGFGITLDSILGSAEAHLNLPARREIVHYDERAYENLEELEAVYSKIPFNDLHGNEKFYPLFVTNDLLKSLRARMDAYFKEPSDSNFKPIETYTIALGVVGSIYWSNITRLLEKIREYPEGKDFKIELMDHKGETWTI